MVPRITGKLAHENTYFIIAGFNKEDLNTSLERLNDAEKGGESASKNQSAYSFIVSKDKSKKLELLSDKVPHLLAQLHKLMEGRYTNLDKL